MTLGKLILDVGINSKLCAEHYDTKYWKPFPTGMISEIFGILYAMIVYGIGDRLPVVDIYKVRYTYGHKYNYRIFSWDAHKQTVLIDYKYPEIIPVMQELGFSPKSDTIRYETYTNIDSLPVKFCTAKDTNLELWLS